MNVEPARDSKRWALMQADKWNVHTKKFQKFYTKLHRNFVDLT